MKKVMVRAWEISKEAAQKFGGKAMEYIAEALKTAWKEIKSAGKRIIDRIAELEALGFKRWQKNGMDRLYINATTLGLDYSTYKSGNISGADFQGEHISNSEARRMLAAKTYIDVKTETVHSDSWTLERAAAKLAGLE